MRRHTRRSTIVSLALIAAAVVAALVPMRPSWVERFFSAGMYPLVQRAVTRLSNRVPFALFDLALVLVSIVAIISLASALARFRSHFWRFIARATTVAAGLYLVFLTMWGLNYRREPLRQTLDFQQERVSQQALSQLTERAVAELNAIYPRLPRQWPAWDEMRSLLEPAFGRAMSAVGSRSDVELADPKRSLLNIYFKRTAVDGMVDPFFLEVLVNRDVLPFERPFTVAHEWGHLAGRADESEASFLGWMTCMHGPLWARYGGWISLYGTFVAGLPPHERSASGARLAVGPRRDLIALSERIARQSAPIARRASEAAYDRFLKANRLREGVASYGLVVTLLLGVPVEIPPLDEEELGAVR